MSTTLRATATIELDNEVGNLKWDFIQKYFDREDMYHYRTFTKDDLEDLLEMKDSFEEDYMKNACQILIDGIEKYGEIEISIN